MEQFAQTPSPPYFVVIFTSRLKTPSEAYQKTAQRMVEQARAQPGFLGIETAREELGITLSYWKDEASIVKWKNQIEHQAAQKQGKELWYSSFCVRVAKVERDYSFNK